MNTAQGETQLRAKNAGKLQAFHKGWLKEDFITEGPSNRGRKVDGMSGDWNTVCI